MRWYVHTQTKRTNIIVKFIRNECMLRQNKAEDDK